VLNVVTEKTGKKLAFTVIDDLGIIITRARALRGNVLNPYLFTTGKGKQFNKYNFNSQWRELKEKAGLQESDLHFHDLRAKAGTDADNAGINAQKLLGTGAGHRRINTLNSVKLTG
jgi:integrase